MSYETEVTVLGGLLVTVEFTTAGAEPDVGIFGTYVDEWSIVGVAGVYKNCDWIEKRLSRSDEDRIAEACNEAIE